MKKIKHPALDVTFDEFTVIAIEAIEAEFGKGYLDRRPELFFAMMEKFIKAKKEAANKTYILSLH